MVSLRDDPRVDALEAWTLLAARSGADHPAVARRDRHQQPSTPTRRTRHDGCDHRHHRGRAARVSGSAPAVRYSRPIIPTPPRTRRFERERSRRRRAHGRESCIRTSMVRRRSSGCGPRSSGCAGSLSPTRLPRGGGEGAVRSTCPDRLNVGSNARDRAGARPARARCSSRSPLVASAEMPGAPVLPLTGGCNCRAVRFEISEPLLGAVYCHCTRCQRRTGTAAAASAGVKPGTFRLVSGEVYLRRWNAGDGNDKAFCGICGSALFSQSPENPESFLSAWGRLMATRACGLAGGCTSRAPPSGSRFRTMA
jgi:hypothetical protein